VFETFDVVAMPTTPMTAHEYVPGRSRTENLDHAWSNLVNTCVFNMTGHPSVSVPRGTVGNLPTGLMLTGARFDDAVVLDAGRSAEAHLKGG